VPQRIRIRQDGRVSTNAAAAPLGEEEREVADGARSRTWRALRRDPGFWVGLGLGGLVVGASLLAPVLAPHDPEHAFRELMPPDGTALGPSTMFPLGTDPSGRDYLSRLLYAGRATLLVGVGANLVATLVGTLVGLVAGYARTVHIWLPGRRRLAIPVESLLMRLTDVALAFPALLLAVAASAVIGRSLGLVALIVAGVLWTTTARLVHGRVAALRRADFVLAGRALGAGPTSIVRRHLLPHVLPLVVAWGALGIATTLLFESALSFLGAGAPATEPTWGRMLAETVTWYRTDLRLPLLPGLAIAATVLAASLLGDAFQSATDPRRGRRSVR
jgi:peptide/nickel transport system permease protein